MKNKTLLLIFLILLSVFLISQYAFERKTRSFKTALIQVDTAAITSIRLYPKSDNQKEILLKKENDFWVATQDNVTTEANAGAINALLRNLALIKTKRVAAKKAEKWSEYEMEEGKGSRVKVYKGDKLLEDFTVGRFNFNQQTRSGTSYVRLEEGDEVYAIDGFLSMTIGQGFESYRNKDFLNINKEQINKIAFSSNGIATSFLKEGDYWMKDGIKMDSTLMSDYLSDIQSIVGTTFVDDFEETQNRQLLFNTLSLEGTGITTPIIIKAFRDTTRAEPYILQSSQNQNSYFASGEDGLYGRLFNKFAL